MASQNVCCEKNNVWWHGVWIHIQPTLCRVECAFTAFTDSKVQLKVHTCMEDHFHQKNKNKQIKCQDWWNGDGRPKLWDTVPKFMRYKVNLKLKLNYDRVSHNLEFLSKNYEIVTVWTIF